MQSIIQPGPLNNFFISPVSLLSGISKYTGKTSAIQSVICLRPSELYFILDSMSLSDISTAAVTLSIQSKSISDAINHIINAKLVHRLHNDLQQISFVRSSTSSSITSLPSLSILDRMNLTSSNNGDVIEIASLDRDMAYLFYLKANDNNLIESFEKYFMDETIQNIHFCDTIMEDNKRNDLNIIDNAPLVKPESEVNLNASQRLASMNWLISASRLALSSLYNSNSSSEQSNIGILHSTNSCNNIGRGGRGAIKELVELREKLSMHSKEIKQVVNDMKAIQLCKKLCSNYKAQMSILLEQLQQQQHHHRKGVEHHYPSTTITSPIIIPNSINNLETSPLSNQLQQQQSTVSLDYHLTSTTTTINMIQSEDIVEGLSKIITQQFKLEKELQDLVQSSNISSQVYESSKHILSSSSTEQYNDIFASTTTPYSQHYQQQHQQQQQPIKYVSKLAALTSRMSIKSNSEYAISTSPSKISRMNNLCAISSTRTVPNPLYVVMQSVFSSSPSK